MKFTDKLKDTIKNVEAEDTSDEFDIADAIRNDPKYTKVVEKLRYLTIKRDEILRALRAVELDIDACLVLISYGKEKEEIENQEKSEEREER